jgi:uncharacterized protein (TIGR03382 family)
VTQVYRDDRAAATDQAVDDTRGEVVVRSGTVVRAEYSAENAHPTAGHDIDDPVCAGATLYGHGRGACQWGTQRWATGTCFREPCGFGSFGAAPKTHDWMIEHYYPGAAIAGGAPAEPCTVLGEEGGILDDAGPCFDAFGPAAYWRVVTDAGHGGGLRWTNAFQNETPSNWARWNVHLAAGGEYRVAVRITDAYAGYGAVRYEIRHGGAETEVVVDQSAAGDEWVELGVFEFAGGGDESVSVFDNYAGSVPPEQQIVADAVRIEPASAPPVTYGDGGNGTDAGARPPGGRDGGVRPGGDATIVGGPPKDGDLHGEGCSAGGPLPSGMAAALVLLAAILLRRRRR